MSTRRAALALAGACAVAAALYAPTLQFGFVWDDRTLVVTNAWLGSWSGLLEAFTHHFMGGSDTAGPGAVYYRPLVHLLFFVVRALFGSNPAAFHGLQLLLHVVATALVGVLAQRLVRPAPGLPEFAGPLAALLFAVHPIHLEAVAWISSLGDVGATVCVLGVLVLVSSPRELDWPRVVALGGLCLAGAWLKETGVLALPLAATWLWLGPGREASRTRRLRVLAAGALALLVAAVSRSVALWGVEVLTRHAELTPFSMVLTGCTLFAQQLAALLWPADLAAWHTLVPTTSLLDPRVWAALAVLAGLLAVGALAWRRGASGLLFLTLFLLVTLLPGTVVPRLGENAFAERYLYLPSVALALALALALDAVSERLRPALVAVGLAAAALGVAASRQHLPTWRDQRAFFLEIERRSPEAPILGQDLGVVYLEAGQPALALEYFRRSRADTADYWSTRAVAHAQLKQYPEAERCLKRSLEKQPRNAPALANLCKVERLQGRLEEATRHCAAAVEVEPRLTLTHVMYGVLLRQLGRTGEARREFAAALALDPGLESARLNLAELDKSP